MMPDTSTDRARELFYFVFSDVSVSQLLTESTLTLTFTSARLVAAEEILPSELKLRQAIFSLGRHVGGHEGLPGRPWVVFPPTTAINISFGQSVKCNICADRTRPPQN